MSDAPHLISRSTSFLPRLRELVKAGNGTQKARVAVAGGPTRCSRQGRDVAKDMCLYVFVSGEAYLNYLCVLD